MIADGDGASARDVTPTADPNMIADDEFRIELFAAVLSNRFKPQALPSGEVLTHRDRGKPAQIGAGTYMDFPHSKLSRQHLIAKILKRAADHSRKEHVAAVLSKECHSAAELFIALFQSRYPRKLYTTV